MDVWNIHGRASDGNQVKSLNQVPCFSFRNMIVWLEIFSLLGSRK